MGTQLRKQGTIWGILLVILGVMMLAERLFDFTAWLWAIALFAAGVVLFAVWLVANRDQPWKAPWAPLIPAYVLTAVGALVALTQIDLLDDLLIAPYVLAAIALPFLIAYLRDRKQWWALIPAYALLAIGLMVLLTDGGLISDELVAPYVLFAIAIPFFVVFARNTKNWWALIPAYVLLAIGLMVLLTDGGLMSDELVAPYVLFAIAVPFFVVFARNTKSWWALIPGGILAVIAFSFLIAQDAAEYIGAIALLVAGVWLVIRQFTGAGSRDEEPDDEPLATVEAKVDEPPAE